MLTNDLESRIEQAEANWQSVAAGNPGSNTWGFFSYSDGPAAAGGGVGIFTWFPDRNAMLDFMATTLPFSPPGRHDCDPAKVARETSAIVEELKNGSVSNAAGIERLNEVLQTFSQIQWMGTFNELLTGQHLYAVEVRAAFCRKEEGDDSGAPILPDEKEAFCEFLETWGT